MVDSLEAEGTAAEGVEVQVRMGDTTAGVKADARVDLGRPVPAEAVATWERAAASAAPMVGSEARGGWATQVEQPAVGVMAEAAMVEVMAEEAKGVDGSAGRREVAKVAVEGQTVEQREAVNKEVGIAAVVVRTAVGAADAAVEVVLVAVAGK